MWRLAVITPRHHKTSTIWTVSEKCIRIWRKKCQIGKIASLRHGMVSKLARVHLWASCAEYELLTKLIAQLTITCFGQKRNMTILRLFSDFTPETIFPEWTVSEKCVGILQKTYKNEKSAPRPSSIVIKRRQVHFPGVPRSIILLLIFAFATGNNLFCQKTKYDNIVTL